MLGSLSMYWTRIIRFWYYLDTYTFTPGAIPLQARYRYIIRINRSLCLFHISHRIIELAARIIGGFIQHYRLSKSMLHFQVLNWTSLTSTVTRRHSGRILPIAMYDVVAHHLLTSHNHNLLYSPVKELLQTSSIVPSLFQNRSISYSFS